MNYRKELLIIVLCFFSFALNAQNQLKKELTKTDFNDLENEAAFLIRPEGSLNFSYKNDDFNPEKRELNEETNMQLSDTVKLKLELKETYDDTHTYRNIAFLLREFNMNERADEYLILSHQLIIDEIEKHPENSTLYSDLGLFYVSVNDVSNAYDQFSKAIEINVKDTIASYFLPMFHLFQGDYAVARKMIYQNIENMPDNVISYFWLPMISVFEKMNSNELDSLRDNGALNSMSVDDLFDLKYMHITAKKHPDDFKFQLLDNLSSLLGIFFRNISDLTHEKLVNAKSSEIIQLPDVDKVELAKLNTFFKKSLKQKSFQNKYILYKSLAFISILDNKYDDAAEYFNKSFDYKNPDNEDYTNLYSLQLGFRRDTLAAMKVAETKLKRSGDVRSGAEDYVTLARLNVALKDTIKAMKQFNKAIELDNTSKNAYTGLATLYLLSENYSEANEYLNVAYSIYSEDIDIFTIHAITALLGGSPEDAYSSLQNIIKIDETNELAEKLIKRFFEE